MQTSNDITAPGINLNEALSVSELSQKLKNLVEENFRHISVRGEIGRISRPASGHVYLDLKDDKAVLNAIIWKGQMSRLEHKPEQGLEVICTGRLSIYPGQSRYQIIIETMAPAGQGALMALLETRRRQLAAEGLFDAERKKPLPFLPERIGVVTSPTGAVIRDILHRLKARFARPVLVWPAQMQGESCAEEVAAALDGFNALAQHLRPDVIIVARGGGSLEDLWPFNDEQIVRAAARSALPMISAIGHETDHTLLDLAADARAPTPTAAAEMVVPVRADLLAGLDDLAQRIKRGGQQMISSRAERFDDMGLRLKRGVDFINIIQQRFDDINQRLPMALRRALAFWRERFTRHAALLSTDRLILLLDTHKQALTGLRQRAYLVITALLREKKKSLQGLANMLDAVSYHNVLKRGFALVYDERGRPIQRAAQTHIGQNLKIEFAESQQIDVRRIGKTEERQQSLFDEENKEDKNG